MAIDRTSETWRAVEAHAERRLAEMRKTLESVTTPADRTPELRGRIAELIAILALVDPPQAEHRQVPDTFNG